MTTISQTKSGAADGQRGDGTLAARPRELATLCYVRNQGRTLMLHRTKKINDYHAGKWNGLGGKLEAGETPEECAIREIREESGLEALDLRLRGQITFPAFDDVVDWYVYLFTIDNFRGELIDSPEGELAWIEERDLLSLPLWPGDRIFIPWVFGDRYFSAKFVYQQGELIRYQVWFYGPDRVEREAKELGPRPLSRPVSPGRNDETFCWVCEGAVIKRHCKIVCQRCGFTRDCSDP